MNPRNLTREAIREEQIQNAIKTLQVYNCDYNGVFECAKHIDNDIQDAFYAGAKWADEHPKSLWINYKEERPPFGVEVIAYHHKWVDEDFNLTGTRVGFLGDDGFISTFWWDYQDCYETISKLHCESNKDFYANHIDNTEPEFWFPIPKFTKPSKE